MHVHEWQAYVVTGREGMFASFDDIRFYDPARPGVLFLLTGLNSGPEPFVVELHSSTPPLLPDDYELAGEGLLDVKELPVAILEWGGQAYHPLDGIGLGIYHVRYSSRGRNDAYEQDCRLSGDPVVSDYRLDFWPVGGS